MNLDDTRRAILDAEGHLLVEGGPGSGKTTIALLKAARTLDALEPEQRVLFLSFSRAAVRQISDRVAEYLPRTVRKRMEIRTFHAFFMEFVRAHAPLLTGTPAVFLPPDAENPRKADYDGDWDAQSRVLAHHGTYVFDQLAPVAATLLERSPALRFLYSDRYPLVIVDEFQDTNLDQWRVIHALAQYSTVIMLADRDQRIFEFIPGVDETRLQQATEALRPERFDLAGDNYRSAGNGILDYANAVLRGQPASMPEAVLDLRYSFPSTPGEVAHKVVPLVQAKLAEQLGSFPTIAVLAPSNSLAAVISEEMSQDRQSLNGRTLLAIDHELVWDPHLSAAAGFVVASILEWPTLARTDAIAATLRNIADYYRVKLASKKTESARRTVTSVETAIIRLIAGKSALTNTAKAIIATYDEGLRLTGNPVTDWRIARARLHGSEQLAEVFGKARLLRLLHATDALAWGLNNIWDGRVSYPGAAETVRRILAEDQIAGRSVEPHPVTLMNMYKSKGKEFDAVIIVEGLHQAKLLDPGWDLKRVMQQRRVLRVAITRARHAVIFIRPRDAMPLTPTVAPQIF